MTQGPVFTPGDTWVVKIGSSLLTTNGQGLAIGLVNGWVDDLVQATRSGTKIVIVSSGAVAEGMQRLGFSERPKSLHLLQAAAAVGQMGLVQLYESSFQRHQLHTAQVLLTHDDLRSRERYINARSTLRELLNLGVIPVVNENDTVATDEIRFGDNDTLAAMVANLVEADTLVLLTDQQGLFSSNPEFNKDAELIRQANAGDERLDEMAGPSSMTGRGGMTTKIAAARIAARSGANTVIVSGREAHVLREIARGVVSGTLLSADKEVLDSRKQWLATLPARGKLFLDKGAVEVLRNQGKSLLPVGVQRVEGEFTRGDIVSCVGEEGVEFARGLVNYSRSETVKIIGRASREIEEVLGYVGDEELIHRDNLVLN